MKIGSATLKDIVELKDAEQLFAVGGGEGVVRSRLLLSLGSGRHPTHVYFVAFLSHVYR